MAEISRRTYAIIIGVSMVLSFLIIALPVILNRNVLMLGGWAAGSDNQRYFILTTGHVYSGQWQNRIATNEWSMGWAIIGQSVGLGEYFVLSILQMVMGLTYLQANYVFYVSVILISLTLPFVSVGLYKRYSGNRFSRNIAAIIFCYAVFGTIAFLQGSTSLQIIATIFYFFGLTILIFGNHSKSDFVVYLIMLSALTISYHTLATYMIIILPTILILVMLSRVRFKSATRYDLKPEWLLIGIGVIMFISVFSIFNAPIGIFGYLNNLTGYNQANSQFFSYPGITASNIFSRVSSFIDIASELIAACIFVLAMILGVRSMKARDTDLLSHSMFYVTISLGLLAGVEFVALGLIDTLGRAYQASVVMIPILLVVVIAKVPKRMLRALLILSIIGAIITPCYLLFYQPTYGIPAQTLAQIDFVGKATPYNLAIVTDFGTSGSLLYYGHLNNYGLSEFFGREEFNMFSSTVYGNGTPAQIRSALNNITGSNSNIVLITQQDLKAIPLQDVTYHVANSSYIKTYENGFDIVYSGENSMVFVT